MISRSTSSNNCLLLNLELFHFIEITNFNQNAQRSYKAFYEAKIINIEFKLLFFFSLNQACLSHRSEAFSHFVSEENTPRGLVTRQVELAMINVISAADITFIMSSSQAIVNWLNALDQSDLVSLMYNNNIQLSPEGEVNSGGYIPRREALRYISTALHRPWGG